MATTTVEVTFTTANGGTFSFSANGEAIPHGNLTEHTGTNDITFVPATGQTWTFVDFSLGLSANVGDGVVQSIVGTNAQGNGESFAITVSASSVSVTDNVNEAAGVSRTFEYGFTILLNGTQYYCDPKMYNQT